MYLIPNITKVTDNHLYAISYLQKRNLKEISPKGDLLFSGANANA